MSFPVSTAFPETQKYWYVVSMPSLISFFFFSFLFDFFYSRLFIKQHVVQFCNICISSCVFSFVALHFYSPMTCEDAWYDFDILIFLRLVLWPIIWPILKKVLCTDIEINKLCLLCLKNKSFYIYQLSPFVLLSD